MRSARPVVDPSAERTRDRQLQGERLPAHIDRLYRAAYALCGSREDAEDLVQETYARVLRRPRWLRQGGELAYLMRALRNVWHDLATTRRNTPPANFEDPLEQIEFAPDARGDADLPRTAAPRSTAAVRPCTCAITLATAA